MGLYLQTSNKHNYLKDKDSKLKFEHLDMSILNPIPETKGESWNDKKEANFYSSD